jgi:hypothetical protein
LIIVSIFATARLSAQTFFHATNGSNGVRLQNTADRIGLGNYFSVPAADNPASTLTVGGDITIAPVGMSRNIFGRSAVHRMNIAANKGSNDGAALELCPTNDGTRPGQFVALGWCANANLGTQVHDFMCYSNANQNWSSLMRIYSDGKVVIGNTQVPIATTYKYGLYVADGILAERVKVAVKTTADWSDYVLAPSFKLRSLKDLEVYIGKHRHLPDVPSAAEVVAQGVDLQKMDATLLQKVEELTLYIIQLEARIEQLEKQAAHD